MGGLKVTRAIQQTQARKHVCCFNSGFCLHFVRFTSRKNKGGDLLWFKASNGFPDIITLIGIYFKMSHTLGPLWCEQKTDLWFLLCSLAVRRAAAEQRKHKPSARRWCLPASPPDLWAAEVNSSHVLIVLWFWHGALAPRRVKLTKVKSAGSIKAHLRVLEPPAWLQGCGRPSSTRHFSPIIIKWQLYWREKKKSCNDNLTSRIKLTWTHTGL